MITRKHGNLHLRTAPASQAAEALARDGCVVIPGVLATAEIDALKAEIDAVFAATGPDRPRDANGEWRYEMLNRSGLSQAALAKRAILDTIEPLLGEDCHVIANTAWRNVAGHQGGPWHIDAGPHVPRPEGVAWPAAIPYPVFAIGMHLYLEDCPMAAGPTAVLAGSHQSGRVPPRARALDLDLTYDGRPPLFLTAKAGDAALFVSDAWHRGTPAEPGVRRFFLQAHYARRDIAQRLRPTDQAHQLALEAIARAGADERARSLIGLHDPFFYDG
jgi:ectoine hydroxylase-related dioxygenase (phytanoyl-CoA dioxygenase family)